MKRRINPVDDQSVQVVGTVTFASGETESYTDPDEYLRAIKEELPFHKTTGFQFQTISTDLTLRASIESLLCDFFDIEVEDRTEMEGVKGVARTLLMCTPVETKFSPMVVQHPFTNSGITMIPKDGSYQVINLMENPEHLAQWQAYMQERIDGAKTASEIFSMLNTPYSLTFLKHTQQHLSQTDFAQLLTSAWLRSEYANSDVDVSKTQLVAMFRSADPQTLMDAEELEQLMALDDPVTVYRGVTTYNRKNVRALSWSLEKKTAEWFAHRFEEHGTVYEARIKKMHILALFNGRNESEIVLDPKHLVGITQIPIQSQHQKPGGMKMR